jgi:hypothetical protein
MMIKFAHVITDLRPRSLPLQEMRVPEQQNAQSLLKTEDTGLVIREKTESVVLTDACYETESPDRACGLG